ncbi:MAG: arsenate reductase (glutaredoxin) [Gammaproteobacteria bacterium]|nr:arsenate reductase (glutaredoxin) [Gammaproteobacteria bacterium]
MSVIIYHNPRCSKSRQTLQLLQQRGIAPQVIEYLVQPPSTVELQRLLAMLQMTAQQLVRRNDARQLGIDIDALSDAALIEVLHTTPQLIERPIVVSNGKAAIGRPPEAILDIL